MTLAFYYGKRRKTLFPSIRYLSPHLYDFLEALITQQTSPDEAYRKFDAIASKHTEQLRKYTKQVSSVLITKKMYISIARFMICPL